MKLRFFPRTRQAFRALIGGQKTVLRLSQSWGRWLVLAALILVTVVIVSPFFYLEEISVREGESLVQPIYSQIPFTYDNPERLEEWKRRRDTEYIRIYTYDSKVQEGAQNRLRGLFTALQGIDVPSADVDTTRTLRRIAERIQSIRLTSGEIRGFVLEDMTIQTLWRHRNDEKYIRDLEEVLQQVYRKGVILAAAQFRSHSGRYRLEWANQPPVEELLPSEILDYPEGVRKFLTLYLRRFFEGIPERQGDSPRAAALDVLNSLITPNVEFDEGKSRAQMERFLDGRDAVRMRVAPGGILLRAQETISETQKKIVGDYNTALRNYVTLRLLGNIGFVVLVVGIIGFYVLKFRRNFTFDIHTTLLTGLPLILVLAVERVVLIITESRTSTGFAGYLFLSGTIGMLGVLLLDVRLALILVTWGSLLFGLQVDMDFQYIAVALLGGYTAVAALYTIRERREMVLAGIRIAFVNAFGIITIGFIKDPSVILWKMAAWGIVNGIVCSLVTIYILRWFEFIFGVVTDMRLLELTGIPQELTRQLEEEAPGTWQHTLNVAKLAEAAAQAIGVNYLLVRAGTYFHDVGKMRKSTYFTENQATAEDKRRHQELRPQMSVLIIRDHVKSGIEFARKAGLPQKIVDFIPQHHGTSLIKYFYHKAQKQFEAGETKAPVREEDYRYPGPKPQSRETAILMLADAVEATATAKLNSPHVREDDIRMVVHETILDKFNDGQFDECDLTLNDLQVIRETFFDQLMSRFHTRIDYPKGPEKREASDKREPPSSGPRELREREAREAAQPSKVPNSAIEPPK